MHLEKLPEPIKMRCFSCRENRLHAPVVIGEDVRYQCVFCGKIKYEGSKDNDHE